MSLTQYTIERTFPVDAERLYRAFIDPDDLKVWVWGPDARDVRSEIDLRINGAYDISMDVSGRKGWGGPRAGMRGIYLVVNPGRKLIYTLHWDAPVGYNAPGMNPLDEVIVVDIQPEGDGCRLKYTHMGIPDDGKSAREHERSVRETLELLDKHLKG